MDPQTAHSKALQFLTQREHSRKELLQKLRSLGCAPEDAEAIAVALAEQGYLDERRYAEAFINKRRRQGYGPRLIRQELQQAGIDAELARELLDAEGRDWQAQAERLYRKKYGSRLAGDAKEKAKRARFLFGKGYAQEHIRACLSGADIVLEDMDE